MVDIDTYRARIGRFSFRPAVLDLDTLRVVGVPAFVGILLFMAGVELNPGPFQVDELSMALLPDKWSKSHVARRSTGNGNCLFNSCSLALCGDETLAPSLRNAVAHELENNASSYGPEHAFIKEFAEQHSMPRFEIVILYQTVLSTPEDEHLSLTMDSITDCIRMEGTKTFEDKRWSTILHVMALSTVIGQEIRSVYPNVPWNYRDLYNNSVFPVAPKSFTFPPHCKQLFTEIVIFWTRDGNLSQTEFMFTANHVVPLFEKEADTRVIEEIEKNTAPYKKRKTQPKLDAFFAKPGYNSSSDTVSTPSVSPTVQLSSDAISPYSTTSITPEVCPDIASFVQRRTQLTYEEKFNILLNCLRLMPKPLHHTSSKIYNSGSSIFQSGEGKALMEHRQ